MKQTLPEIHLNKKALDRRPAPAKSVLAVAFHQFECAVAASNHEVNLYLLVN
jgi:hypothetical protein